MNIQNVGLQAYQQQLQRQQSIEDRVRGGMAAPSQGEAQGGSFMDTLTDSLREVNDLQTDKANMIEAFASGENTNVHELMITMQKAGLTMQMTGAVRSKIMSAYQEVMRMSF